MADHKPIVVGGFIAVIAILVASLCAIGCATQHTIQEWKQKANGIAVGTPRENVERILPPISAVVDVRSGRTAGQLAYWVDDTTLVKVWVDANEILAKPIIVESRKKPKKANK